MAANVLVVLVKRTYSLLRIMDEAARCHTHVHLDPVKEKKI